MNDQPLHTDRSAPLIDERSPDESLAEGKQRLAQTLRRGELTWLLSQQYDATTGWRLDLLRQGALGRWMQQRYRYDEQSGVLYFLGESALSDAEFREARRRATSFPEA